MEDKKNYLSNPTGSIFEKGYGMIPKLVMQDQNLSIEAKAIYSYFCSYSGNGDQAFPSVKKICFDLDISKDRFYRHIKLLVNEGYIRVDRMIMSKSKQWCNNVYTLNHIKEPMALKQVQGE